MSGLLIPGLALAGVALVVLVAIKLVTIHRLDDIDGFGGTMIQDRTKVEGTVIATFSEGGFCE